MIKQYKKVLPIILCLIFTLLNGCSTTSKVKVAPKLDAKAPNFSVANLNGENITLNKLDDKVVIISFWKIESPSALRQLKDLQIIQNKYGDNIKILAVNVLDKTFDINKFMNQYDYTFDVISDKDGKISNEYALSIFPTTFLLDDDGIIKEVKKYDNLTADNSFLKKLNS